MRVCNDVRPAHVNLFQDVREAYIAQATRSHNGTISLL
jgi:hypothetical protein